MGTLDKRVAEMQQMHQNAAQSREGYRQAFIAQTGLMPNQVAMLYGEELVEEGGHILKRFKVRYVPHDIADELRELESQIEQLTLKNCAMQMVIAPLSVKAGISDEAVIELLKAAEGELVDAADGNLRKLSGCEQT